jgi:hypothetical protein
LRQLRPGTTVLLMALALLAIVAGPASAAPFDDLSDPVSYPAGVTPHAVTTGDFDEDADPDIAVASYNDESLSVMLNTGGRTFSPETRYATEGNQNRLIATGDFDDDGHLDLVAVRGSTTSFLPGMGDGSFGASVDSAGLYTLPSLAVVADFDGDGALDLLLSSDCCGKVVYLGNGDGTFGAGIVASNGGGGTAVVDFDADGVLDLARTDASTNKVVVSLGIGDGTFAPGAQYPAGVQPVALATGDIDEDGDTDIVTSNAGSGGMPNSSVLLNGGGGAFTAGTAVPQPAYSSALYLFDVDEDGHLDLVGSAGDGLSVNLGAGNGTFAAAFTAGAGTQWAGSVGNLAMADLDADGKLDFATTVSSSDTVQVRYGATRPVANDDAFTLDEDAGDHVAVLSNDTADIAEDLYVVSYTQPEHGFVFDDGEGLYVSLESNYCTPSDGEPDTFTYTVKGGDTATVALTVTCVDDPPVPDPDYVTTTEDADATTFDVLANDVDPEGDAFAITGVDDPDGGTASIVAGIPQQISYTPDPDFCTPSYEYFDDEMWEWVSNIEYDVFTYTVTGGATAQIYVEVTCVTDPVVVVDDVFSLAEDAADYLAVGANDEDPDNAGISISSVTQPIHGVVSIEDDYLFYTGEADYCSTVSAGPEVFTYTLDNGAEARVELTVTCVDDPATVVDDAASVEEDVRAAPLDVLGNDADVDDVLEVTKVSFAAHGDVVNLGDKVTYTPDPGYCTPANRTDDRFSYEVADGTVGTVDVHVTCVDDAAIARDDDADVDQDDPVRKLAVLTNDSDAEGDAIEITGVTQPTHGTTSVVQGAPDRVAYQPVAGYCNEGGAADTFTYTVTGGDTATVAVAVACVDQGGGHGGGSTPPSAGADTATVAEDSAATIVDVLANDSDDAPLEITAVTAPGHGSAKAAGGGIAYTPDRDYCGPDAFSYALAGGTVAQVTVTVTCVDDAAVGRDDLATADEDGGAYKLNVLANDTDAEGDVIRVTSVTQPTHGTAAVLAGSPDRVAYTPAPDYCNDPGASPDTFTYTVTGGDTATVAVEVACRPEAAPAAPAASPLACTTRGLVLLDVVRVKGGVRVAGITRTALAGRNVGIVRSPRDTRVGSATVASDGTFETIVPAPSRRLAPLTHYRASMGDQRSKRLKLDRRVEITSRVASPEGTRIAGVLSDPAQGRSITITRQRTCSKSTDVATITADRNGRFSALLPAPEAAEGFVYYRLKVERLRRTSYSLPVAVWAAGGMR